VCFLNEINLFAQKPVDLKTSPKIFLGLGLGLDYGGLGVKCEYLPLKYLGLSLGLGYNLQGPGINLGASFKPLPGKKIQPVATLLYGYNAVIVIQDRVEKNKTYYGFSAGLGGALRVGKKGNKLSLNIFYPFRSKRLQDDYEALQNDPTITLDTELLPIAYSIGFNWAI
jgi:hypothetical protein